MLLFGALVAALILIGIKCDYEIICDERVYAVAYEQMYPYQTPYDDEDAED